MERETIVNILSDANYGCAYWCGEMDYDKQAYKDSKAELGEGCCFEDILADMLLKGHSIGFIDAEDGSREDLTLDKLQDAFESFEGDKEDMDSEDADFIIQTALFGEVIYG